MPWITIILSMAAAMSLTLAAIQFRIWLHVRESPAGLLFSLAALAATATALVEAWMMHAQTPTEYGERLYWLHPIVGILTVALAWLIPAYLRAGRLWLSVLITAIRGLILIVNFNAPGGASFSELTGVRPVTLLGENLFAPVGDPSGWRILAQISAVVLIAHAVDAGLAARKLRTRRRPLLLAGAIAYATLQSAVFAALTVQGTLPGPFIGLGFTVVVLVLFFELSSDLIQAHRVARDLEESEGRMRLAAAAADLFLWEWEVDRDELWFVGGDPGVADTPVPDPWTLDRFLESVHPDDRTPMRQAVDQALDGAAPLQIEYRQLDASGALRWLLLDGTVSRDAKGRPVQVRGASRDITDRKRTQIELEARRRALVHAQRVATVDHLSSALLHELSQPLGAILRNAEAAELLLRQQPADLDEFRAIVDDILGDDRRATDVIDRMRGLLKRRTPEEEVIEVGPLLDGVHRVMQAELQARGGILEVRVDPGLPDILGDRVHLQQVLLNLLTNALDAVAPEGGSTKDPILLEATAGEDGWIEFAVRDRGPGVPPDQVADLFEPFSSTKVDGTGLGLSISRTLVEAQGGRIWLEANPGGGAAFRFTMPAAPEEPGS